MGSGSVRRPSGMSRKAGGAGTEPNDPTINRLEYENSNTQWQVVRDGLWRCSLPLLLLWGPLIDRPGSRIVVDGTVANKTTQRSNNQLWGMVEKEGDGSNISLLTNSGWVGVHENTTMINCWLITQQTRRGETTIQQPREIRTVWAPREHQIGEIGAKSQINNSQNSRKLPFYWIRNSRSY